MGSLALYCGPVLERLRTGDRRWLIAGLSAALLLVVGLAGPWGPKMTDLAIYRMGADTLLHGIDIYTASDERTGLVFTYPVFAAALFVPFAVVPWAVARVVITVLSLAAVLVIVRLTLQQVRVRTGRSFPAWGLAVIGVLALAAHPVLETLAFGQVNLILTAMVLTDVLSARTGRWRGVLVGIAAGIKLVPGIFILYFVVTGQRRAAVTATLTTAVTMLLGFAIQPSASWDFWTQHALNPERTGGIVYVNNQSFLAVTARLLRDPHPPRTISLVLGAVIAIVALLAARRLAQRLETLTAITVVAAASLLASPVSWSHHWVWIISALGTLFVWAVTAPSGARWRWWVFGVAAAILVVGPMKFTPKEELRELQHNLPQQLLANVYALLAVVYVAWVATQAFRPAVRQVRVRRDISMREVVTPGYRQRTREGMDR